MIHYVLFLLLAVFATSGQGQVPDPDPVQFESNDKRFVKGMITCACSPSGRGVEEGAVGIITTGLQEVESILAGNSTGAGDMTTEQDLRTQAVLRSALALSECVTATNFEACINVAANMRSRFAGNTLCDHDSVTGKNVRSVDPDSSSTTKVSVGLCRSNEQFASPALGGVVPVVPVTGTPNPPSVPQESSSPSQKASNSKTPAPSKVASSKSPTATPSKVPPSPSKTPAPPKASPSQTPSKTPTPSPSKAAPSPSKKTKPSESASKKPKSSPSPIKKPPVVVPVPPKKKPSPSPSKKSVSKSKRPIPSPSTSYKPPPSTSPTSSPSPSLSPSPSRKPCVQTSWLAERGLMMATIKQSGIADVLCIPGLPCGTHGHLLRAKSGELRTYREVCAELTVCTFDRVEVSQLSHAIDWAVFESYGFQLTSLSAHPESTTSSPTRRLAMLADIVNRAGLGHFCNLVAMMPHYIDSAVHQAKFLAVETRGS